MYAAPRNEQSSRDAGLQAKERATALERATGGSSETFLWAVSGSICGPLHPQVVGREDVSLFAGRRATIFPILGLYNAPVRLGSD